MSFALTAQQTINVAYVLGDAAVYDPCNGKPKNVTVVPSVDPAIALQDGIGVRTADITVLVRKSEIAEPKQNDRITISGVHYLVDRAEPYNQWEWLLDVRKA